MRGQLGLRSWVVAVGCAAALAACGDDDGGNAVESVTQLIGPSGGTVELPSGGKVTIPQGALSEELNIKVTRLDTEVADLPSNLEPAGKPYAFEPHGTTFAQPVKIEIPYEGTDVDVRPMKLPNETADTSEWTTVFPSEKDTASKSVSMDTMSFSVIRAARPRRNSGVVTLPDGAVVDPDAGMDAGGTGGDGGTAGEAGTGGMSGMGGMGGSAGDAGSAGTSMNGGSGGSAGEPEDAGVDAGPTCTDTLCHGNCIDTTSSFDHCGGCDQRCGAGEQCNASQCVCPSQNQCPLLDHGGETDAGASNYFCADLQNDREHCGDCDTICTTGFTCSAGACVAITCAVNEVRCGNECVAAQTDRTQCGGCVPTQREEPLPGANNCPDYPGYQVCGNACIDTNRDENHCGGCDQACGAAQTCSEGTCVDLSCGAGEIPCKGVCVSGTACGERCETGFECNAGECSEIVCPNGQDRCGDDCIDPNTSKDHCGGCSTSAGSSYTLICAVNDESCMSQCEYGYGGTLCGLVPDVSYICRYASTDEQNCGGCGIACGSDEECVQGYCEELLCGPGQIPCNGQCISGTACGTACGTGFECTNATCGEIQCTAPLIRCGDDCVDPASSAAHCGGCGPTAGEDHGEGPTESYTCYAGDFYCSYDCSLYSGDFCDGYNEGQDNECYYLDNSRDHCGECGNACAGDEVCNYGTCTALLCDSGEVACNGICVNGDACGATCALNAICTQGTCGCDVGTIACGSDCARLDDDERHCGACNNECEGGQECVAGTCVYPPCPDGGVRCNGECVDTSSDEYNCGGCAPETLTDIEDTCYPGESCFCENQGLTECPYDQSLATCADTQTNRNHCGACGNACATGSECVSGACQPINCGTRTLCGNTCVESPSCGERCNVQIGELCGSGVCYQGT